MAEPRPSRLRQLLERPDARPRITRAVASLLGAGVASIGVLGILTIWHLVRRGRLIREKLPPPRAPSDIASEPPERPNSQQLRS